MRTQKVVRDSTGPTNPKQPSLPSLRTVYVYCFTIHISSIFSSFIPHIAKFFYYILISKDHPLME